MALTEDEPPDTGDPYEWDASVVLPSEATEIWSAVALGLERNQTVVWKNAVESLDQANRYFEVAEDARKFVEESMAPVISILVEQQPGKIGQMERGCVEESLFLAVEIIAKDLRIQIRRKGESKVLGVLSMMLTKKKAYYKGHKGNWGANHMSGLPEVRLGLLERFRAVKGLEFLSDYMRTRYTSPQFPSLDILNHVLGAVFDCLNARGTSAQNRMDLEPDAIYVCQAVIGFISACTEDLKKLPQDMLSNVRYSMQLIFDALADGHRKEMYAFYEFWRALTLKLITSQSLPLKLFGWEQVNELIEGALYHRPPPRSYLVSGAGRTFCDGQYEFRGLVTPDGFAKTGADISYVRSIPEDNPDGGGKNLTLFRCTMRSQQKWWFLSEADKDQPGTDRDIDYYQHKSQAHEERQPPPNNWIACPKNGTNPPPMLQAEGLMVPPGEEYNTLEHQLARWAIEKGIIEDVLGDSLHREIVARSTPLIKFLAFMCERDSPVADVASPTKAFCLQSSHLLLAWKTCTSNADEAVSNEVNRLLVSILPSLSSALAITLLTAVQTSLQSRTVKRDYLPEVAEFCSVLATSPTLIARLPSPGGSTSVLSDNVRTEVLKLLWAVLTHPDASSLQTYDNLKQYVRNELKVEPMGSIHRENFLETCREALLVNSEVRTGSIDEVLALRMVKLTHFVLEACPRDQAVALVSVKDGALASLIFDELTAYITRRNTEMALSSMQKRTGNGETKYDGRAAMSERLKILRYAYGVTSEVALSLEQLKGLWELCSIPSGQEDLMIFIASASVSVSLLSTNASSATSPPVLQPQQNQLLPNQPRDAVVAPALGENVRTAAFLDLFCSSLVKWGELGEGAYTSFQQMFRSLEQLPASAMDVNGRALDALWRICLDAGNDSVASQAMKDLLSVYVSMAKKRRQGAWANGQPGSEMLAASSMSPEEDFGRKVFQILIEVAKGLKSGDVTSERKAERLFRILNEAIAYDGSSISTVTSSTVALLSALPPESTLLDAIALLPHGMRGQSSYRRVGVTAMRTTAQSPSSRVPVQETYSNRGGGSSAPSQPAQSSKEKFIIDVHPLETLLSVKEKVASYCKWSVASIRPVSISGRLAGTGTRSAGGASSQMSLGIVPDSSLMDDVGVVHGCEMVFVLAESMTQPTSTPAVAKPQRIGFSMGNVFADGKGDFAIRLFDMILEILASLPWRKTDDRRADDNGLGVDSHKLVWDLLFAMPSNEAVVESVRRTISRGDILPTTNPDAMMVESTYEQWSTLLDRKSFHRSVYVMQVIDSLLQPAPEVFSCISDHRKNALKRMMFSEATQFRLGFISSGGFDAVARFFAASGDGQSQQQSESRMGNAVALRILKCCLFGIDVPDPHTELGNMDDQPGMRLLQNVSDTDGLMRSLTAMVVNDEGISSSTISDVQKFLLLLFQSPQTAGIFVSLPDKLAEKFLITLLLWDAGSELSQASSSVRSALSIRREMHDIILRFPMLGRHALPWLIQAMDEVDVTSYSTDEYFDVLRHIVAKRSEGAGGSGSFVNASSGDLLRLGTAVCKKLASCPRPTSDNALIDFSTGVLCDCLKLLKTIIEYGGGAALRKGTSSLLSKLGTPRWSDSSSSQGVLSMVSSAFHTSEDITLVDLMGVVFDGFLSPRDSSSSVSICCDNESRKLGFDVVAACAKACRGPDGYLALVTKIGGIVDSAAPYLYHRWGQHGANGGPGRSVRTTSRYSGLRNQGCTCYMNSFLQQLFMMPELRNSMCAAPLPASLRTAGGSFTKGNDLVGKKIALQWESGISYDAIVEGFDADTRMHTIRYCRMKVALVGGQGHHQVAPDEIAAIPPGLPDEFILSEGRPGRETGVFEIAEDVIADNKGESTREESPRKEDVPTGVKESEDEASSRHLLEEVQRTFIHLDEGSRGRCFDPRALVEACNCLKLEFDVWQQNDASEFAMKLLDRMEIALKKWAPEHFRYLEHTFGLKQTKLKICKECGLKTKREENLMSIDCQIRGKTDIHDALSAMCEVEHMEGSNKVFCDECKQNTDTVLKTAISALPDMLILSLKRFDLDYNTFETVKLNSRCAFGETLNMKRYTLEAVEATDDEADKDQGGTSPMDTDEDNEADAFDPLSSLPDEDFEYKLAGVLVHAGVAQGGHYYSFIRDRASAGSTDGDKWYRFDDEDVTPFDAASIEAECFGGKVKRETKIPTGQVHSIESEQFANALMLFYEKVKRVDQPAENQEVDARRSPALGTPVEKTSGYYAFEPDVQRANATHKWQSFFFDKEFHCFLRNLLEICRYPQSGGDRMETSPVPESSWHGPVVQMLLRFVLDVLLYSAEKSTLGELTSMLCDILIINSECAKMFVHDLARRTTAVSSNWLKTYLSDCPDRQSRLAALRIFAAAVKSCSSIDSEEAGLLHWSEAWQEQMLKVTGTDPLPTKLEGHWSSLEDTDCISQGKGSAIGKILSYLTTLLEAAPRTWRYNAELFLLIRDLAHVGGSVGSSSLRSTLFEAQVPARLLALALRGRAPPELRHRFPGATMSFEVADSQVRMETSPTTHMMPLGTNEMHGTADVGPRSVSGGQPAPSDYYFLFEAFACLVSMPGGIHGPLIVEAEDSPSGRPVFLLTDQAASALKTIFQETCENPDQGITRLEMDKHFERVGIDSATLSKQRVDYFKKRASLPLEEYLDLYREAAHSNDDRVRLELHAYGYRPDLVRRPARTVFKGNEAGSGFRLPAESVAIYMCLVCQQHDGPELGPLVDAGIASFTLFYLAYAASEPLADHLLAFLSCSRDSRELIEDTLRSLYHAPQTWNVTHDARVALMTLKILCSVEDEHQLERISTVMLSPAQAGRQSNSSSNISVGLLKASKTLHEVQRRDHRYSQYQVSHYSRYVEVIRELATKVSAVHKWMFDSDNARHWKWMENDLRAGSQAKTHHHARADYSSRRDIENFAVPLDINAQSDSDMRGIHESEDDDDDSRGDLMPDSSEPRKVYGAGLPELNGVYEHTGDFDGAFLYSKRTEIGGRQETVSMFRCAVTNDTKHWFISLVPKGVAPGTNQDRDFYSAPVNGNSPYPPTDGWVKQPEGQEPAPRLVSSDDGDRTMFDESGDEQERNSLYNI